MFHITHFNRIPLVGCELHETVRGTMSSHKWIMDFISELSVYLFSLGALLQHTAPGTFIMTDGDGELCHHHFGHN